jgi:DNA-binding transcriptional MerR regulator
MICPPAAVRAALVQTEAAAFLGVNRRTLHNWRRAGFGPKPSRVAGRLLYDRAELEAFARGARVC